MEIEQFIAETLENSPKAICRLPERAKDLIKESLVRRAGGMYVTHLSQTCPSLCI
jgi:hypothetical protein